MRLRGGSAFSRTVGNEKLQRTVSECNVERVVLRFFWSKRQSRLMMTSPHFSMRLGSGGLVQNALLTSGFFTWESLPAPPARDQPTRRAGGAEEKKGRLRVEPAGTSAH